MNSSFQKLELLSPAKDCCQECAVKHDPKQPHNAQSLYYAFKFNLSNGRSPTWADAMAHCSEEVKAHWIRYLEALEIDINSPNKTGDIKTELELQERLKKVTDG